MESPSESQKSSYFTKWWCRSGVPPQRPDWGGGGVVGRGEGWCRMGLAGVHSAVCLSDGETAHFLSGMQCYPLCLQSHRILHLWGREKQCPIWPLKPCPSIRGWSFLKSVVWFPSSWYTQHSAHHRVHTQMYEWRNELGIFKYTKAT